MNVPLWLMRVTILALLTLPISITIRTSVLRERQQEMARLASPLPPGTIDALLARRAMRDRGESEPSG